jgi:hypothetical protein
MTNLRTLLASEARIVSGVGATVNVPSGTKALMFMLDVTATAQDVGDLLDVYVQDSQDGIIFTDLVRFTQVLGNGGVKQLYAIANLQVAPTLALGPVQNCSMAAGVRSGPCGPYVRSKYVITPDGDSVADQSFTFGLNMLVRV